MNKTLQLAKKDLYTFPLSDLETLAIHKGIPVGTKRQMVTTIAKAIHVDPISQSAEMPTDKQAIRTMGLTKKELKLLDILVKDLDTVLKKHKVRYILDAGGLLGSQRQRSILYHDEDLDLGVLEQDEKKLHKALKELEGKYEIEWDLDTEPDCRRVMVLSKTENGFPFVEFFIYKLKNDRTRYRCKEDEESWGEDCYHEIKHLFPRRDYYYGKNIVKGPNSPVPYLNRCYGESWPSVAYRQQSHKGGFYYDEDRRVKVTRFNPIGGPNDKHVYDPDTRKWVKKGSKRHNELIKKGYYTKKSKKPLYNPK